MARDTPYRILSAVASSWFVRSILSHPPTPVPRQPRPPWATHYTRQGGGYATTASRATTADATASPPTIARPTTHEETTMPDIKTIGDALKQLKDAKAAADASAKAAIDADAKAKADGEFAVEATVEFAADLVKTGDVFELADDGTATAYFASPTAPGGFYSEVLKGINTPIDAAPVPVPDPDPSPAPIDPPIDPTPEPAPLPIPEPIPEPAPVDPVTPVDPEPVPSPLDPNAPFTPVDPAV